MKINGNQPKWEEQRLFSQNLRESISWIGRDSEASGGEGKFRSKKKNNNDSVLEVSDGRECLWTRKVEISNAVWLHMWPFFSWSKMWVEGKIREAINYSLNPSNVETILSRITVHWLVFEMAVWISAIYLLHFGFSSG